MERDEIEELLFTSSTNMKTVNIENEVKSLNLRLKLLYFVEAYY